MLTFQCRLEGQEASDWADCASPQSYGNLSNGAHTFEVRARDVAGNLDPTRASYTWTIDTSLPPAPVVTAMYAGSKHGFLIRDANENQDAEQQYHSREKNDGPQLVLTFKPAP